MATGFHAALRWTTQGRARVLIVIHPAGLLLLFFLEACAILLVWFLLACGDVEANPGPQVAEQWMGSQDPYSSPEQAHGATRAHRSGIHRSLLSLAGYSASPDPMTANSVEGLQTWCSNLQADNEHLKNEVYHLNTQCMILQEQCSDLLHWKDWMTDMIQQMDGQIDKIESFSRRNNLRFFNVLEDDREDDLKCTRKVVQLLNRFYPMRQWTVDDVERAHRLGRSIRNPN